MQNHRTFGVIAACALLGACGSGHNPQAAQAAHATASGDDALPPMAQSDTGEFHHDDPCSLLTPAEVEAALGAKLGTAPFRGPAYAPTPHGEDCVYMTRNFQTVTLNVTFDGGQQAYHIGDMFGNMLKGANSPLAGKAKTAMVSDEGSEIAGDWDEAKLTPMNCCIFNALRANQMISIDFTGSTLTLKQAAGLVDAAFKRIDKPLALDGGANVAAAGNFLKTRPQRRDPCSVLTQAEVEAIVGKLAAAPKAQGDECSYQMPELPEHPPRIYTLDFTWHDGNYAFRQDLHVSGIAGAAMGGMTFKMQTQVQAPGSPAAGSTGPSPGTQTREVAQDLSVDEASKRLTGESFSQARHLTGEQDTAATGPWERSATVGPKFEAVKQDVLVKSDLWGVDPNRARALVELAMKKF